MTPESRDQLQSQDTADSDPRQLFSTYTTRTVPGSLGRGRFAVNTGPADVTAGPPNRVIADCANLRHANGENRGEALVKK